jgi:8-oxo-dGTP pyrophosphatase MutT (NUDIX family)
VSIHGPADGWVVAPDGRKFWGKAGAAGLLIVDASGRVLLQHRVEWSHFGGTWGIPGGARAFDESAVDGALRESAEEASVPASALRLLFTSVVDLGFWSYTTVVAEAVVPFEPVIGDGESEALEWVPIDSVDDLPLHPGFASSWARLRPLLSSRLTLVVDAANVVGSTPDGWWKDRAGATSRLVGRLSALTFDGLPAASVADEDAVAVRWPSVVVVVEGQAKDLEDPPADPALRIVRAASDGDSAIVAEAARAVGSDRTVVVTADRGLAVRVEALGASVLGPRALLDLLP